MYAVITIVLGETSQGTVSRLSGAINDLVSGAGHTADHVETDYSADAGLKAIGVGLAAGRARIMVDTEA